MFGAGAHHGRTLSGTRAADREPHPPRGLGLVPDSRAVADPPTKDAADRSVSRAMASSE